MQKLHDEEGYQTDSTGKRSVSCLGSVGVAFVLQLGKEIFAIHKCWRNHRAAAMKAEAAVWYLAPPKCKEVVDLGAMRML